MPNLIYRSEVGHAEIRDWCARRLARLKLDCYDIDTRLGMTSIVERGDGRAVVLVPGTNFATATWAELLTLVGENHRAIGVDLPGQPGMSSGVRPAEGDAYGPWLREVLEQTGVDAPVVVGHSLGARVGLLGAANGAAVAGLVLVNPAGLIRLRVPVKVLATTIRWLVRRNRASSRALLQRMAAPRTVIPQDLIDWMTLVARHVRTSLGPAALPDDVISRVRCPVWLVAGTHDPFLPSTALVDAYRSLFDPRHVDASDTAGHLLPEEEPDRTLRAVEEVVLETDRGPGR